MSPLVLGEILAVFVNTLTADGKYPVQGCENLQLPIQMQLSEKRKTFSQFLFHLSMLREILNILKEKMIVIANMFPKLQTVKIFVRKLSQEHRFRTGFGSQHVKAFQLLAKSPRERFYHVLLSFSGKLIWNMSPLVLGEMLGMLVNTWTPDSKYLVQGCENLQLSFLMQLSENQKIFSEIFVSFLQSTSNFKDFEKKKMIVIANVLPNLGTVNILVRALSKKRRFRTPFDSPHVKASEIVTKSA